MSVFGEHSKSSTKAARPIFVTGCLVNPHLLKRPHYCRVLVSSRLYSLDHTSPGNGLLAVHPKGFATSSPPNLWVSGLTARL